MRSDILEAEEPGRDASVLDGLVDHGLGSVGRVEGKAAFGDPGGIPTSAAAEFKNARAGFETIKECIKVAAWPSIEAGHIARRVGRIPRDRGRVGAQDGR